MTHAAVAWLTLFCACAGQAAPETRVALPGHWTATAAAARVVGAVAPGEQIPLTLALRPRDEAGLSEFLQRVYDPSDPLYGHYLTPREFAAQFSPTEGQYAAVAAFARASGLTITATSPNRLLLNVQAPSAAVEAAFGVNLERLAEASSGRVFHAPDSEPSVPASIAPLLVGVLGLDNSAVFQPQAVPAAPLSDVSDLDPLALPQEVGTGPNSGLSPANIKSIFNLTGLPATPGGAAINGSGQTLAVFELDSYLPSDISGYESYFAGQLGTSSFPTVTPVPVDGGSGTLNSSGGQAEVTLDIELQIALAPGANSLLVYEGPNSFQGVVDTYNQIAIDDKAQQISTSWGLAEDEAGSSFMEAEAPIFAELAAQGQTIYAASGDAGAKSDGKTLSVEDPASQPFVTGTGGTSLSPGAGETYGHETTWGNGGGGVSAMWQIPSWQLPVATSALSAAHVSTTMRNVPDVAFDADPNTGYAVYVNGGWALYGGTSCAAPVWAGFTALVNQERAANALPTVGFANPRLYAIGGGQYGSYANDFHDIVSGSNGSGGYYNAVAGFDDATGLGTFNGASLFADLASEPTNAPVLSASVASGAVTLSWTPVSGATGYNIYRALVSGNEGKTPYVSGLTGTTYTDTGLANGATYYYYVFAIVSGGVSLPSNEVAATPGVAPTVTTAAAATPSPVTGKTTALSAQGSDPQGETLTYTWSATGPASVTFSANGTSTANDTTATFTKAGSYTFTVTVTNTSGLTATSSVPVTVNATPAKVTVTPSSSTVVVGGTQQFTASAADQFGNALSAAPTWAVSGGGTITSSGLFTATTAGGPDTVTATLGSASGTASVTVTSIGSSAIAVANFGFESPSLGTGSSAYSVDPTNASWTFTGVTGITANGSAFNNPAAPQGTQVAFLEQNGTISQSLGGFAAGQYTLTISSALYNGTPQSVAVQIDGTTVGTVTPTSTAYQTFTVGPFAVTAGTHTLSFVGTVTGQPQDCAYLDNVQIVPASSANVSVLNFGFEAPSLGTGFSAYSVDPANASWTFTGVTGIAANGSAFNNPPAPQGTQFAFLEQNGTISQSVGGFQAEQYVLTVSSALYNGTPQSVAVQIDGTTVGMVTPTSTSFTTYTVGPFTTTAGAHTLSFVGTVTGQPQDCAYLDNVQISPAPVSSVTIPNFGFESPSLGTGSSAYSVDPTNASWTFTGVTGITANGSAFNNPAAPQGTQVAFLEQNGTISQSLGGFAAGQYTLTISSALYNGTPQSVAVQIDGTTVGTVTPTSTAYQTFTVGPFAVTAGTHTLSFVGTVTGQPQDCAYLDNVVLQQTS